MALSAGVGLNHAFVFFFFENGAQHIHNRADDGRKLIISLENDAKTVLVLNRSFSFKLIILSARLELSNETAPRFETAIIGCDSVSIELPIVLDCCSAPRVLASAPSLPDERWHVIGLEVNWENLNLPTAQGRRVLWQPRAASS